MALYCVPVSHWLSRGQKSCPVALLPSEAQPGIFCHLWLVYLAPHPQGVKLLGNGSWEAKLPMMLPTETKSAKGPSSRCRWESGARCVPRWVFGASPRHPQALLPDIRGVLLILLFLLFFCYLTSPFVQTTKPGNVALLSYLPKWRVVLSANREQKDNTGCIKVDTCHRKEALSLFVADWIYGCYAGCLLHINKICLKNENTKHKHTFLPVFVVFCFLFF